MITIANSADEVTFASALTSYDDNQKFIGILTFSEETPSFLRLNSTILKYSGIFSRIASTVSWY